MGTAHTIPTPHVQCNPTPLKATQFDRESEALASFEGQPPAVWAAFLCMNADGIARSFCYQAVTLRTPAGGDFERNRDLSTTTRTTT